MNGWVLLLNVNLAPNALNEQLKFRNEKKISLILYSADLGTDPLTWLIARWTDTCDVRANP